MWLVWLQMCQNGTPPPKKTKQIDDCNVRKCNVWLVTYYITTSVHLYVLLLFFCCVECCRKKEGQMQNMSTNNINEWAHAEKWLTGRTRPVTEAEDEAVSWCPVSDEWRSIICFTESRNVGLWLEKMEEMDGLMQQPVDQDGWWVYLCDCRGVVLGTAGLERCCKIILYPFFWANEAKLLSSVNTFLDFYLSPSQITDFSWLNRTMVMKSVFFSLLCWCFVDDWYGFAWHLIHEYTFPIFMH